MAKATNVVPFPSLDFPEILAASVHSPGVRFGGSRNEVWLCPAFSGSKDVMLYVKPALTVRQMVAELVAAQVGICMGLPCPQPYLVSVAPHHIGGARGPVALRFGCEQVGPRGLARPVHSLNIMLEMLKKAKCAEGAAVLDEWIVNSVRGPGDVVFDPEGGVWLIDHEAALEGGIAADASATNWLAMRLAETLSLGERAELLKALRARAQPAQRAHLGRVPPELGAVPDGQRLYSEVIQFLRDRLQHLDYLLSHRVLPEQAHLQQHPIPDSTSNDSSGTTSI